jgi:hypothetical protein
MRKLTIVIVCMMLITTFSCIFSIKLSGANEPPYVPMSPYPDRNSTGVPINAHLGWSGDNPNSGDIILYFIKPKKGYLYVGDSQGVHRIFITTLIIGSITVEVYAFDNASGNNTGISHVEFYLDGVLIADVYTGENNTYSWFWGEPGYFFFPCILGAKAYDLAGNSASIQIRVWKLF